MYANILFKTEYRVILAQTYAHEIINGPTTYTIRHKNVREKACFISLLVS